MSYHNTNGLHGAALEAAERVAYTQEARILEFFTCAPRGASYTPDMVLRFAVGEGTPITSVRRAMTNLTKQGLLERLPMSERCVLGPYGKPVHSWRLGVST